MKWKIHFKVMLLFPAFIEPLSDLLKQKQQERHCKRLYKSSATKTSRAEVSSGACMGFPIHSRNLKLGIFFLYTPCGLPLTSRSCIALHALSRALNCKHGTFLTLQFLPNKCYSA